MLHNCDQREKEDPSLCLCFVLVVLLCLLRHLRRRLAAAQPARGAPGAAQRGAAGGGAGRRGAARSGSPPSLASCWVAHPSNARRRGVQHRSCGAGAATPRARTVAQRRRGAERRRARARGPPRRRAAILQAAPPTAARASSPRLRRVWPRLGRPCRALPGAFGGFLRFARDSVSAAWLPRGCRLGCTAGCTALLSGCSGCQASTTTPGATSAPCWCRCVARAAARTAALIFVSLLLRLR